MKESSWSNNCSDSDNRWADRLEVMAERYTGNDDWSKEQASYLQNKAWDIRYTKNHRWD